LRLKLLLLIFSLISASDVSKKLIISCPVAEKDGRTFAFEIAQKVSAVLNKLGQNDIQSDVPFDSKKLCLTI
jgi:hypothetical protein